MHLYKLLGVWKKVLSLSAEREGPSYEEEAGHLKRVLRDKTSYL